MADAGDITFLLHEAEEGRPGAIDELMRVVYTDLERMASSHLRRQFGDRAAAITLEPAALVNETFMKLIKQRSSLDNRGQFFGIATRLMIRVLIDYRRARNAAKRGGGETRLTLQFDGAVATEEEATRHDEIEIDALRRALDRLEEMDSRKADVVKMRIVWGLNNTEIAEALGVDSHDRAGMAVREGVAGRAGRRRPGAGRCAVIMGSPGVMETCRSIRVT